MTLRDRRVLLVIGGGIAAYKALDLIRRLRERGASVRCILTAGAQQFVTPLAASALSGERSHTDLFDRADEADIGHIRLARDADAIVVAPATASLMSRMAAGSADDLAATVLLATALPILLAPAMNVRMWQHPATRRNLATLLSDGVHLVGPNEGRMAENETGPGRMAEPGEIADAVEQMLALSPPAHPDAGAAGSPARARLDPGFRRDERSEGPSPAHPGEGRGPGAEAGSPGRARPDPGLRRDERPGGLRGRRVLVTSGPTHEPIDPVRYIANRSSGRQGHAIAAAAAAAGADVTLVSGPVGIPDPPGVRVVRAETARDMLAAVEAALPADVAVFAAAVADWRSADEADRKLKKDGSEPPPLRLALNPDILATVARRDAGRPPLVVGFAAETEQVVAHAQAKLARKGCDVIVANDVAPGTGIMGGLRNTVHIVTADGVESWPELDKDEVAHRLVLLFASILNDRAGPGRAD